MRLLTLKNVLVATELDEAAVPAIIAASRLADAAGALLHVVSAVTSLDDHHGRGASAAEATAAVSTILRRAGARPDEAKIHVRVGDPASAIGALADRISADVIALGPHREDRSDNRPLGGTALAVVTNAASPCLIVSAPLRLPLHRVLVPVDLSDTARGALLVGLSWASALRGGLRENAEHSDVKLTALHVRPPSRDASAPGAPQAIEREVQFIRQQGGTWAGVSIHGQTTVHADVARAIVDFATEDSSDLVVMGTRGLGLDLVGRLGSVSASVMKSLAAPTLLVPPAVWMEHTRVS
jgi:nucleotide-binding universal stress UspA family protein